jgi:hypothetical protein
MRNVFPGGILNVCPRNINKGRNIVRRAASADKFISERDTGASTARALTKGVRRHEARNLPGPHPVER